MIHFQNIKKVFDGGLVALHRVSARISQGEFLVILGPSGSGKTTLLRTVNGLVAPTEGKVEVNGIEVKPSSFQQVRCMVGMIFQQFNLVGNLSVINNVLAGSLGAHQKWYTGFYIFPKKLRLRALEVIDRVGLLDKAYYRTDKLSGGQQQRVGIARALIQRPKVLLADEPIASLDPLIANNILSLLKKISSEDNITVLCSLHQVDFATRFSQRIIGLNNGRVVMDEQNKGINPKDIKKVYGTQDPGMFFCAEPGLNEDESLISWSEYR